MSEWANVEGKLVFLKRRRWWQIWKPRMVEADAYPVSVEVVDQGTDLTPFLADLKYKGPVLGSKFEKVVGTYGRDDDDS